MILQFPYKVRYQDTDCYRRLKLPVLEEYLLDVAGQAADVLGIGYDVLLQRRLAWVLIRITMQMRELPTLGTDLIIETWVSGFAHALSPRFFRIYRKSTDGGQEEIGRAASVWTILNLDTRQMENIFTEDMFQQIETHEELPISFARVRKIENTQTTKHIVTYSDLDYNNHCNSCKYLAIMLDASSGIIADNHPLTVDLSYQREVHKGDELTVRYAECEDYTEYAVCMPEGTTAATGRISKITNF